MIIKKGPREHRGPLNPKDVKRVLKGRGLVEGYAQGVALVSSQPISFLGGVDPETGMIIEKGHELEGEKVTGRILVFPHGKGSTVGSYILYRLATRGLAPKAIINVKSDPVVVVGCVISNIPLVDSLNGNPITEIKSGDRLFVDGYRGEVYILK
ncbi:MAG: DUF126 domain-containing protein [Candidatus Baldrarchaeia archaeon]